MNRLASNLSKRDQRKLEEHRKRLEKDSTGLIMKYFVLNPLKDNEYGNASRKAILKYAEIIKTTNMRLSIDLKNWIGLLEK